MVQPELAAVLFEGEMKQIKQVIELANRPTVEPKTTKKRKRRATGKQEKGIRPWCDAEIQNCPEEGIKQLNQFLKDRWEFFNQMYKKNSPIEWTVEHLEKLFDEFYEIIVACAVEKAGYIPGRKRRYEEILAFIVPVFLKFELID